MQNFYAFARVELTAVDVASEPTEEEIAKTYLAVVKKGNENIKR